MNAYTPYPLPASPVPTPRRHRRPKGRRSAVHWALGLTALGMLAYMYVGGSYGWYRIWSLKQQKAVLEAEVSRLEARRLDLSSDLELLRGDPKENPRLRFEMERLAREKHGMVRKDELVYRFHPEEPK